MVLTIFRTTGVVTLIEENDKVGGICRLDYRKSVVLPTKTLKAPLQLFFSQEQHWEFGK